MKPNLAISFSGGRTSAVMTKLCFDKFKDTHDIAVVFSNTGCEHEDTLKFVNQCDKNFGWNVVWVEAVINPEYGKGIRHKVVCYETASRYGEPFEEHAKKYGIPGPGWSHCTRDLKQYPIEDYLKSKLKWKKSEWIMAIGIRSDEIDRVSPNKNKNRFVYPLVEAGWTKEDVINECLSWPFDLELKGEHYGNCVWCWKKSIRKLATLATEDESIFDFPSKLEKNYSKVFPPKYNGEVKHRFLFRNYMTTVDILDIAKKANFELYSDVQQTDMFSSASYDVFLDTGGACGDSCEVGAD
jgi:hypothetical protein